MSGQGQYRVRFVVDEEYRFEECHGEARPLTEEEYRENEYCACPEHPRAGSGVVGAAMGRVMVGCRRCGRGDYAPIPYEEYLRYYGNPERHVYVRCEVQRQCTCCQKWTYAGGTGGIDLMDDDGDLRVLGEWLSEQQIKDLGLGYLGEVAREDLAEAKEED